MELAGLSDVRWFGLTGGIVTIHVASCVGVDVAGRGSIKRVETEPGFRP